MDAVKFRLMKIKDLDEILEIEKCLFTEPWNRENFEKDLEKETSLSYVAVSGTQVIAYIICWFVVAEVHIGNIAVHPDYQRQKIGERLVQKILSQSKGFAWAALEVRKSNYRARSLYKKLGFIETGVLKKYYLNDGEDAILMSKALQLKDTK